MPTTIHDILDELRASALDERDKGDKFERLMQGYFRTDPEWTLQFSDVWLWSEWPGRSGKPDTGIDLVAKSRDSDELTAIQCKFYAPHHTVQKADIDSFFTASGKIGFSRRIIVSTSDKWSKNAEDALVDQRTPTQRLDISNLSESVIDWSQYSLASPSIMPTRQRKELRRHQQQALEKVREGLAVHDRGKLVMACGTGKTFTSLRIAEDLVGSGGTVLFLVPSISLLSQTLREWTQETAVDLRPFAVCSDIRVGRKESEDMSVVDLAEPATTDATKLLQRMKRTPADGKMTVIFSTYQSIQVVADAQSAGLGEFDLIICDEAHRTTGVTLKDQDESTFFRVHKQEFVKGNKRLYMTATPRIFKDDVHTKAAEAEAVLTHMDKVEVFGPELHHLSFGEAVERGLLSDYKVLVLAVDESAVSRQFQAQLADEDNELRLNDAAKLVGCWNGLAKRGLDRDRLQATAVPMRRAVAFADNIAVSQRVSRLFEVVSEQLVADSDEDAPLSLEARHVDGTFNILERNRLLDWLKADQPEQSDSCRILTNARCLAEGVDVPALDAVLFLNPRNSVVDVVQSVGRVMRKAPGKEYGYVILPIGIPAGVPPEQALADNKKYKVVWQVLQALRAHDERFDATVNKIELNRSKDDKLQVIGVTTSGREDGGRDKPDQGKLDLAWSDEWRDAIYAKIVAKVGNKGYWDDWADDIATIAERHVTRIKTLLEVDNPEVRAKFAQFHAGLKANLNDGVTQENAIEMLAQHIITKPVFDALFEGYAFAEHNPVSLVMQDMLDAVNAHGIDKESEDLAKFYASVRMRAEGIDNAEGKQRIITELYEKFFRKAFPKAAESLGIVYTPVEIVDFIIRSVEHLLQNEFNASLNDDGVHLLDPFTGTGTFVVRLLQSGLISRENILRKYTQELHANEISLLAYYVAAVNIEATFHGLHEQGSDRYTPFDGIVLTDTFQMHEDDDTLDPEIFTRNNDRVMRQKSTDVRVIVGNPPYSKGQTTGNDDNANMKYPSLDNRIESTYVAASAAKQSISTYDSYIRAIRWASDRVKDKGIVAYVSNGGYISANTADGIRKCLVQEFDAVYVYNLRGNQRYAGEQSRREGGKIFGSGSRTTTAIMFLVKNGQKSHEDPPKLHYRDIGEYLTREQKLSIIDRDQLAGIDWQVIIPNEHGDWIDQRSGKFATFTPIAGAPGSICALHSSGAKTNRDAWIYNFSAEKVGFNMRRLAQQVVAEAQRPDRADGPFNLDAKRVSWSRRLRERTRRGIAPEFDGSRLVQASYRPFTKQWLLNDVNFVDEPGKTRQFFPAQVSDNIGIYLTGVSSKYDFSALMTRSLPDVHLLDTGQFVPRYSYQETSNHGTLDFEEEDGASNLIRTDNVTDSALQTYRATYGSQVTKDDIFHYVYGILHAPDYRSTFAADLKKMLPRIPLVADFASFASAGRELARLHTEYESAPLYDVKEVVAGSPADGQLYKVRKMTFGKGPRVDGKRAEDRSCIIYNSHVTLTGIPQEAYRYMLGPRSAIEWVMDRYQVRVDTASGIVNDPNDRGEEADEPRYIVNLLKRIVTVSLETVKIVESLPPLELLEQR